MENKNSFTARITGLSELAEPLEIGKSYDLLIKADCNSITKEDNDDGTFTYKHSLRQVSADITSDNGKVIKVKDTKSQSQKLRFQITFDAMEEGKDGEIEYDRLLTKLRHNWPVVRKLLETLE